ncbi:TonB-dependent receptor [Sphingopyxis panaciterrae]
MAIQTKRGVRILAKLAGSVSLAVLAMPAHALDASGASAPEGEIVVSGIRASLAQAADIKREAAQVMDVITSEDVGKLPDANVAEALQRVTGVQITRVFGEGQAVNIRGLQQVRVEVDGRTLLGWSARVSPPENDNLGRSSGLDSVPSSLFGRLEVRKSPLASQVEGGLGGTVNLVTPKPFDFKKTTLSFNVQGTYSDAAEKFEPGVSGLFTTTFADGRIGVLLAAEYQKRTSNLQLFERNNFFNSRNGTGTGGVPATDFFAPRLLQYENVDIDRSRLGINGSIQFEVTPDFVVTADGLYSEVKANRTNQFIAFNMPTSATALIVTDPVVENGYIVAGTASGNIRTGNQVRKDPTVSMLFGLNGKYDDGKLTLEADGYFSRGTLRQKIEVVTLQTANNSVRGTFDFRGRAIPDLTLQTVGGAPFDPTVVGNYPSRTDLLTLRANELPATLEEWTGRFDMGYKFDSGVTLRAGVRYVDLRGKSEAFRSRADTPISSLDPYLTTGSADFLSGIKGNFPRQFLSAFPDYDFLVPLVLAAEPSLDPNAAPGTLRRNAERDYDLREQTLSGYLMFDAEGEVFGRPVRLNAGVRLTHTDFTVDTFTRQGSATMLVQQTDTNSYTNVLPSANVTVEATDRLLVRLSASQTMQRAGLAELAPSTFVDATNLTSTGGNAQLTPPISSNLDLSLEYYTSRTSLISAALFYKDVSDFIATNTTEQIVPEFENLGVVRVIRPENVASAKVRGFEVGITQFFDFLPAPFDGFGVIANYTFADSKDSNGFPLVATSKHSYNLVGLYEKGPISARVAYNWRDDAVFEFTQRRPEVIAARAQLDAQIGYELTDNFTLSLQAQNLMPKKSATVEISNFQSNAINSYALSERRFSVGLRAKF